PAGSGITLRNSTMTTNSAFGAGGICRESGSAITLESSIVSGNVCGAGGDPDIRSYKQARFANFNAVGSNPTGGLVGSNNLPLCADLQLGQLAYNGGPTTTHALESGSAAVDAGSNPMGLTTDQRGVGFARSAGGDVDIGATELINLVVLNTNDSGYGSLRQT